MKPWLLACLLMVWAPSAAAAGEKDKEEGAICLAVAHHWSATLSETRNIRTVPIAPGFRAIMDGDSCARFQLAKRSLIDWHLAFGNEASTAAALSYLEAELLRGLPGPTLYTQALRDARQRAGPKQSSNDRPSAHRKRFEQLADKNYPYRQIAQFALAAAEEFGSLPLLVRSEAAIGALEGWLEVAGADESSAADRSTVHDDETLTTTLRTRAAVLRADLTRSEADIQAAEALLQSAERPYVMALGEEAYRGGEDFCEIDEENSTESARQACADDDFLAEQVIGYWHNRAMLDLVKGVADDRSVDIVLRLLERERISSSRRCCHLGDMGDLLRLRLMLADRHRGALAKQAVDGEDEGYEHWWEALDQLEEAEALTRPDVAPERFRRIAERWLALWRQADAVRQSLELNAELAASHHRHAAYLRRLLPQLDAIAVGEE